MVFWPQFDAQLFGMLCPSVLVQGLLDMRLVVTQVAGVVVDCTVAFLVTEMSKFKYYNFVDRASLALETL